MYSRIWASQKSFRWWWEKVRVKQRDRGRSKFKWLNSYVWNIRAYCSWLFHPQQGCVSSTSKISSSFSYFDLLSLPNRPLSFVLSSLSTTHFLKNDIHPNADAPLIFAGLQGANRRLTFCLTVQCMLFPKGSIKLWYWVSQGKGEPGFRVDYLINNMEKH